METDVINDYKEAGRVWKECIKLAKKETKVGIKLIDLARKVEDKIKEENCGNAFPINLSLNNDTAHFTPAYNDTYELVESDVLKVDIGVHKNGYICDGAITINLDNKYAKMIEANELALENAISKAEFGKPIDNSCSEIENTLKEKGFNPIYNLGGHGLAKFNIHAPPSISNHKTNSSELFEESAVAIEPFASTGKGFVSEAQNVEIFSLNEGKNVRNLIGRKIMQLAKEYQGLPFAERWLREKLQVDEFSFTIGLRELMKAEVFHCHHGLKETKGIFTTQAEKSLLILEDKTIVLGE
ncbi:MAG: type II methionyl aminopeptidase [Candidatus ainarchaeum sp.]|nr:type II methionyl aminopeptidase [Candidatus ainarchaeum sp.]